MLLLLVGSAARERPPEWAVTRRRSERKKHPIGWGGPVQNQIRKLRSAIEHAVDGGDDKQGQGGGGQETANDGEGHWTP